MKIKILKDIPGFKAGEVIGIDAEKGYTEKKDGHSTWYDVHHLLKEGWAEEVKG